MATTKTIKMRLENENFNGIVEVSDSAWNVEMYASPRDSIKDLVSRDDCKKYGVYLLLSNHQIYVGQSRDLAYRTKQHMIDKDWWTRVVLMTTENDSFTASDIDYLEARLIDLAKKVGKSYSDNKKSGNPQKVDKFRQAELEQYLKEVLFLLELIDVHVFKKEAQNVRKTKKVSMGKESNQQKSIALSTPKKPPLPDSSLGPCIFARTALESLLASGYTFTDEQMQLFGSVEGSKLYTRRDLPLFWILKDGETRANSGKDARQRYWASEYTSGKYRFLMYSQWYDNPQKGATKEQFTSWYKTL